VTADRTVYDAQYPTDHFLE